MGIAKSFQNIQQPKCFICGKRVLYLPASKVNGDGLELLLHDYCIPKLVLILQSDLAEIRKIKSSSKQTK